MTRSHEARVIRKVDSERERAEKQREDGLLFDMVTACMSGLFGALARERMVRACELLLERAADFYVHLRGDVEATGFLASLSGRRAPALPHLSLKAAKRAQAERLFDNDNGGEGA